MGRECAAVRVATGQPAAMSRACKAQSEVDTRARLEDKPFWHASALQTALDVRCMHRCHDETCQVCTCVGRIASSSYLNSIDHGAYLTRRPVGRGMLKPSSALALCFRRSMSSSTEGSGMLHLRHQDVVSAQYQQRFLTANLRYAYQYMSRQLPEPTITSRSIAQNAATAACFVPLLGGVFSVRVGSGPWLFQIQTIPSWQLDKTCLPQ